MHVAATPEPRSLGCVAVVFNLTWALQVEERQISETGLPTNQGQCNMPQALDRRLRKAGAIMQLHRRAA